VAAGVYYFSSHKGGQERVRIPAPKRQELAGVLDDLRQVIVNGAFVHSPNEDDCTFCDFKAACTAGVNAQAEAKRVDAKLVAYGRLTGHV
jgi:CRISPR/Cas system-associated exonuclease Cas4 (RecB family)